jgi:hypothetical protein
MADLESMATFQAPPHRTCYRWRQLTSEGDKKPSIRSNSAAASDGRSVLMFSGNRGTNLVNSMWKFYFETQKWVEVPCQGQIPPARDGHSLTRDDESGRLYVFGGQGKLLDEGAASSRFSPLRIETRKLRSLYRDLYTFDPATSIWSEIDLPKICMTFRRGHSAVFWPAKVRPHFSEGRIGKRHGFAAGIDITSYDAAAPVIEHTKKEDLAMLQSTLEEDKEIVVPGMMEDVDVRSLRPSICLTFFAIV